METNIQSNDTGSVPASPVRLAQWVTEKMLSRTTVTLQGMMYNGNLIPEQVENLYLVYMQEQHAYSRIRNIAELYGEPDSVSSLRLATYNPEHYLNALVRHILKLTAGHSIEIIVNCDNTQKSAIFDLRRTNMILYNLISNAIIHNNYKQNLCVAYMLQSRGTLLVYRTSSITPSQMYCITLSYIFQYSPCNISKASRSSHQARQSYSE